MAAMLSLFVPFVFVFNNCINDKKSFKNWVAVVAAAIILIGGTSITLGIVQTANYIKAQELNYDYNGELDNAIKEYNQVLYTYQKTQGELSIEDFMGKMMLIGSRNFNGERIIFLEQTIVEECTLNHEMQKNIINNIRENERIIKTNNVWNLIALVFDGYKWLLISVIPIAALYFWKK